jgi:hypothetical protein
VQTTQTGPGTLSVTVTLNTAPGTPANAFERISFDALTNATVEVPGSSPGSSPFLFTPGPGHQATFTVRRTNAGQFMVRLTVVDACGPWQTFVGGGANVP